MQYYLVQGDRNKQEHCSAGEQSEMHPKVFSTHETKILLQRKSKRFPPGLLQIYAQTLKTSFKNNIEIEKEKASIFSIKKLEHLHLETDELKEGKKRVNSYNIAPQYKIHGNLF